MSKTLLTGVGAALGAALLLAACGSDKSTTSTTTTTTTTPGYGSGATPSAPAGSTTIERSTTTKSE
ncbi:hypothetical protein [Azospirillum sp. B510]|uniref:hypothetical protein n=1 Tax=Azospirillum sp. (strain B510) TaxID=137722 RepID=UPI0005A6AF3C|nr:hypothetical protein [Azospirillum sp. B510]